MCLAYVIARILALFSGIRVHIITVNSINIKCIIIAYSLLTYKIMLCITFFSIYNYFWKVLSTKYILN